MNLINLISVQGHEEGDGLGGASDVVQLGPSQDRFRSGHGRTLPRDDANSGNGITQSNHSNLLRYGKNLFQPRRFLIEISLIPTYVLVLKFFDKTLQNVP
jgi:hypothetical protein